MNTPLYDMKSQPIKRLEPGNSGLWFERFFNQYNKDWQVTVNAKKDFLKQFSSANNTGMCGDKAQLASFYQRHNKMINTQKGISGVFENDWHWVSGMGNSHPIENGLLWHRTLATPYLAGSSVKGLVRAWMERQEKPDHALIHQWFGSDNKDPSKIDNATQAGQVIFYDATPYARVNLVLDVMTPHTGQWLSDGGLENAPADWHDPIPIFFLSCKKIKLHFSISKMAHADESLEIDKVWQALIDALDFIGSGAKTGTGYGFMVEDETIKKQHEEDKEKREKAKTLASLSAEKQILVKLQERLDNKGIAQEGGDFYSHLKKEIENATAWGPEDKQAFLELAKKILTYLGYRFDKKSKAKDLLKKLK